MLSWGQGDLFYMKKYSQILVLFSLCFVGAFFYSQKNVDINSIERDPAAINAKFDFSNLQGESLYDAVKKRLVSNLRVSKLPGGTGITLGHFLFVDSTGQKRLACQQFEKVILTFAGDGTSVGGDRPTMEITGDCSATSDLSQINPVILPVGKILEGKPGDGEFQFNDDNGDVHVKFTNLSDSWPRTWLLQSVHLMSDRNQSPFFVSSEEVNLLLGHPLVMTW